MNRELIEFFYIHIVFPISLAVFAMFIRKKYKFSLYLVATIPFLVACLALMLYTKKIYFGYWSGFSTWSLLAGCASIFVMCLYKGKNIALKIFQTLFAFIVFNIFIASTSWIS